MSPAISGTGSPWRENPDEIIRMTVSHSINDRGLEKITWDTAGISGFARWWLKPFYLRARRLRLRREQISSIYTASYGWFRVLFLSLADRLVKRGVISDPNDVFFLTWPEIQTLVEAPAYPAC